MRSCWVLAPRSGCVVPEQESISWLPEGGSIDQGRVLRPSGQDEDLVGFSQESGTATGPSLLAHRGSS